MKINNTIIILLLIILSASTPISSDGLFGIRLNTIDNNSFELDKLQANKGSIIVFLLPDCPACESYSATINVLRKKFMAAGFEFYGVFPGKFNTREEMLEFRKQYKVEFPLLQDPDYHLVKSLGAKVVPSAFLINNKAEVLYKGRIDDWLYALGKKRRTITKHDLQDAIESVNNGKVVKVKETTPIGCILE